MPASYETVECSITLDFRNLRNQTFLENRCNDISFNSRSSRL